MSTKDRCCTGELFGNDCTNNGWTPLSAECKTGDYVRRYCGNIFQNTVGQSDSNGFYKDVILSGATADREVSVVKDNVACLDACNKDTACTGVYTIPTTSAGAPAVTCFRSHGNPSFVSKPGYMAALKPGFLTACQDVCDTNNPASMPSWCINIIRANCVKNMNNDYCKKFCQIKDINCDSEIKTYCNTIGIDKAKDLDVCACFLPTTFYEKFYENLQKIAKIPIASTTYNASCTFPRCANSILKPYSEKQSTKCPDIFQCIVNVDVNNEGQISGDIKIDPSAKCNEIKKPDVKPDVNPDGGGDGGNPKRLSTPIIIAIVLGILLVLGLIIGLVATSGKKKQIYIPAKNVPISSTPVNVVSSYDRW